MEGDFPSERVGDVRDGDYSRYGGREWEWGWVAMQNRQNLLLTGLGMMCEQ